MGTLSDFCEAFIAQRKTALSDILACADEVEAIRFCPGIGTSFRRVRRHPKSGGA